MLRKTRIALAAFFLLAVTALFLDGTLTLQRWLGFTAKAQFLPAVMAGSVLVIVLTLVVALLFGRIYCSAVCPLGITQDVVSHVSGMRKGKKFRFKPTKEVKWLRYGVLILFFLCIVFGVNWFVAALAPYSAYGRMVRSVVHPALPVAAVAGATFVVVAVLSWIGGRTYCNTICPVGTTLSIFSRFAMFRPVIEASECKNCHACEKKCKASCIDISRHSIDYSRCVDCFDCVDLCPAIRYKNTWKLGEKESVDSKKATNNQSNNKETKQTTSEGVSAPSEVQACSNVDTSRRAFIAGSAIALASGLTLGAQSKKRDGGFAKILPKTNPERTERLVPFGSRSVKDFYSRCTACQLCVSACPNGVLKPSTDLDHFMQPYMSFTDGYCRPECVRCSQVCPAGAILPITPEQKTSFHIGTATVVRELCLVETKGAKCGNCARHCPVGAITMVPKDPSNPDSAKIPAVDESLCIGCGACENLCPSRPESAIRVNGLSVHKQS